MIQKFNDLKIRGQGSQILLREMFLFAGVLFCLNVFGQIRVPQVEFDTVPDFNHQNYVLLGGEQNRIVTVHGKEEYVLIHYEKQVRPHYEYFRLNDSIYHCIEYYPDSSYKAIGDYLVTNSIIDIDTSQADDLENAGVFRLIFTCYRQMVKTGEWTEFDQPGTFRGSWKGNYSHDKRVGVWSQLIYAYGSALQEGQVDYGKDSTKYYSEDNLAVSLPIDSVERILKGRWTFFNISCQDDTNARMLYYKCGKANGEYEDNCNNKYAPAKYYDFLQKNKCTLQFDMSCNKSFVGKWKVISQNDRIFIQIDFPDSKESRKLKVLYLNRNGFLVTEEVK